MKRHYLTCLPQHEQPIIDGTKTTTIRTPRKRPIAVGDTITFRVWVGRPYGNGSTVRDVRTVTVTGIEYIEVHRRTQRLYANVDGEIVRQPPYVVRDIAQRDGFAGAWSMIDYLTSKQPTFTGHIYSWEHK